MLLKVWRPGACLLFEALLGLASVWLKPTPLSTSGDWLVWLKTSPHYPLVGTGFNQTGLASINRPRDTKWIGIKISKCKQPPEKQDILHWGKSFALERKIYDSFVELLQGLIDISSLTYRWLDTFNAWEFS